MSQPAWIYARFSTLEQAKGHSLERQLKGGRELIAAKGWLYSADRELVDEGRSAFHGANREAGAALHDFEMKAREGHFANGAVLVVESLDRLTRQGHEETVDLLRLLTRKGVTVATSQDGKVYEAGEKLDLASVITIIVKAELNHEEIEKRQKRNLAAWSKKIDGLAGGERKAITAMVPAWLTVDPETRNIETDPYRAALLNQIYDWYIEGRGLVWIERELNRRCEPTWSMRNNHKANGWNTSSLHKMLTWRAVLGEYEPKSRIRGGASSASKGLVIPDYYPQVITAERFNAAQAVRAGRQRTGGKSEHTHNNLFLGMVTCGECGGPAYHQISSWAGQKKMTRKRNGDAARYQVRTNLSYLRCNNWRRHHICDNRVAIRYEVLERAVLDYFGHDAVETILAPDAREIAARAEIAEMERLLTLKQQRLANVVQVLADTPIKAMIVEAAWLEGDIDILGARLRDMERSLEVMLGEGVPATNLAAIQLVLDKMDSVDPETRYIARVKVHTALKNLVAKVVIWSDGETAIWFKNGEVLVFDQNGARNGGTDGYCAGL